MEQSRLDRIVDIAADLAGRADEIDDVIVLYQPKGKGPREIDNGVTIETAIYMMECFKNYLLNRAAE